MIRDERGQALVEFALVLPLMLMLLALVLDAGLWTWQLNRLHTAANSAAQAGAAMLPDTAAAETRAQLFAEANGAAEIETHITEDQVTVTVRQQGVFIFAVIFMDDAPVLTGRAVYGRVNYQEGEPEE